MLAPVPCWHYRRVAHPDEPADLGSSTTCRTLDPAAAPVPVGWPRPGGEATSRGDAHRRPRLLPASRHAARGRNLVSRAVLARALPRGRALAPRPRPQLGDRVADRRWIAGLAPGDDLLEESIGRALANTGTVASITGLVALAGLLWTASGMAASVRLALAVVWEEERGRPYVRAKIVDLALVFLGVALVLAAFVANVAMQLVTTYGAELAGKLGLDRVDASMLGAVGQSLVALAITIAALLVLYRLSPNGPPLRELLPGAIAAGSPRTSPSSASPSTSASWRASRSSTGRSAASSASSSSST